MTEALRPLASRGVYLLFLRMALLLVVTRVGSDAKRLGLPAVVGGMLAWATRAA